MFLCTVVLVVGMKGQRWGETDERRAVEKTQEERVFVRTGIRETEVERSACEDSDIV